jgi:hypothetical protein
MGFRNDTDISDNIPDSVVIVITETTDVKKINDIKEITYILYCKYLTNISYQ